MAATGDDRARSFDEDTRIIFNADGSYVWRLANGEGAMQRAEPSEQPQYLIAEKGAKLYVRGTVRGIFTVYSPSDIEIEDDLVYLKDPRADGHLARLPRAHLRARHQGGSAPGHRPRRSDTCTPRCSRTAASSPKRSTTARSATMFIYGSLTAGTISDTEPRYATKLDYDKRFEYLRPASFPDDAPLRGRLLGPGLERGRRGRKRPAGRAISPNRGSRSRSSGRRRANITNK